MDIEKSQAKNAAYDALIDAWAEFLAPHTSGGPKRRLLDAQRTLRSLMPHSYTLLNTWAKQFAQNRLTERQNIMT